MAEAMVQQFRVGDVVTWLENGEMMGGKITGWTKSGSKAFTQDNRGEPHSVPVESLAPVLLPSDDEPPGGNGGGRVETREIPLAGIIPSRWQPREPVFDADELVDLMHSIDSLGLFNPVTVFEIDEDPLEAVGQAVYELVAGERRVRASIALALGDAYPAHGPEQYARRLASVGIRGLNGTERRALADCGATIRANVEPPDLDRLHLIAVMENIQRADLTPVEEARGFQELAAAYDWSQRELAERIGRSQSYVAQRMALLALPETTRQAVSTRVLTISHARALGAVPEALQAPMTAWAVRCVENDDSPATTREIEQRARQVALFLDPARWAPPEGPCRPKKRNRMAMVQWLLTTADLEDRADKILALGSGSYSMLDRTPQDIAAHGGWMMEAVCEALAGTDYEAAFDVFTMMTDRACETCILNGITWDDVDARQHVSLDTHCPKWGSADLPVCSGWIGVDDPVAIPVSYSLKYRFERLEIEIPGDGLMRDVDAYVDGIRRAAVSREQEQEKMADMVMKQTRRKIGEFVRWQTYCPQEDLDHFQSHACERCTHYLRPLELSVPACLYQVEPLRRSVNGDPRPPNFGVLVGRDGRLLPRCEGFIATEFNLTARTTRPIELPSSDRVLDWLKLMQDGRARRNNDVLWAPLQWLDYGHRPGEGGWWGELRKYLSSEWDVIGSRGIALLIDTLVSDLRLMDSYSGGSVIELYNPQTHEVESWVPMSFVYLTGTQYPSWHDWPEDWPKPWEDPENVVHGQDDDDADGS